MVSFRGGLFFSDVRWNYATYQHIITLLLAQWAPGIGMRAASFLQCGWIELVGRRQDQVNMSAAILVDGDGESCRAGNTPNSSVKTPFGSATKRVRNAASSVALPRM